MSGEACPMPVPPGADEEAIIERLLSAKRIAVVGLAEDPARPSHYVSEYMMNHGKEIIPVNPNHQTVLGKKCYASLKDVPGQIDLVNVFRRPLACPDVVRDAITVGAKGIWLQSGIANEEAKLLAQEADIPYIQNRCLMVEHSRHG